MKIVKQDSSPRGISALTVDAEDECGILPLRSNFWLRHCCLHLAQLGLLIGVIGISSCGSSVSSSKSAPPDTGTPAAATGPLKSWFVDGFEGKKIVYWGNSTVSNAYQIFIDLGVQTQSGGLLDGLEYRWDMEGVEADADENVTVTLESTVTYSPGQWVSIRFANPNHSAKFWQPSVQIKSVHGNTFTYSLRHVSEAA